MRRFLQYIITIITLVCLVQANIYSVESSSLPSTNTYPYGISSLAADQASTNAMLLKDWEEWKSKRITSSGASGFKRVQTAGNQEFTTCSEGMGYGMLLSVYFNEKALFDDLYRYAKKYFNEHGLMDWSIDKNGTVAGKGPATDGDEDMATALVFAHKRWGSSGIINYEQEAKNYINNLYRYCVEPGTYILKPGEWGGSEALNPCYFVPAWYRIYADFTGNQDWLKVVDKCYDLIINKIGKYNNGTGLVPDWCKADGTAQTLVVWNGAAKYEYSYDAARMPWRIALDYSWYGTQKAKEYCDKTSAFFKTVGVTNIVDGYSLTGQKTGVNHNPTFVVTAAAGCLTGSDLNFGRSMFNEAVKLKDGEPYDYYGNTLRLLTLMYMSGNFPNFYSTTNTPTNTSIPTSPVKQVPEDINEDRAVNIADVMLVAAHFNTTASGSNYDKNCDLNNDGAINIKDIMMIASKFNYTY